MRPEPLPAQLIVHGLVVAGLLLVVMLCVRAIITRRATGCLSWGKMVTGGDDPDGPWLDAVRERAEEARRAAAEQKARGKTGRMRPGA